MGLHSLKLSSNYNTGGLGHVYFPRDPSSLHDALLEVHKSRDQLLLLGAGTNSLVMDDLTGYRIICLQELKGITFSHERQSLLCLAGTSNEELLSFCLDHHIQNFSWMAGLPGLVGGTVRMNARCYGDEMSRHVIKVSTLDLQGILHEYSHTPKHSLFRGYKDTIFMDKPTEVVSLIEFAQQRGDLRLIKQTMHACLEDRKRRGQFLMPSCGCVFKNNYTPEVSVPSGLLLQLAGAEQLRFGKAYVHKGHQNFVFHNHASAWEVLSLTHKMRELVFSKFGVWLEYEMEVLGNIPEPLKTSFYEKRLPQYQTKHLKFARDQFLLKSQAKR